MVLGIKEYPCQLDNDEVDTLINFIDDTEYQDNPIVAKTEDTFLDYQIPVIEKLRLSYYDSCSRYWNMNVFDYKISSWIYVDWKGNTKEPYMHAHNLENPYTLSGIMYLQLPGSSGTAMFPMPNHDPYHLPKKLFTWFIFPSNLPHMAGKGTEDEKRYSLSADLYS
tara:strand:+ start:181 stop:678 length:498 start_codon:yes stop_codon:yes gene_type:complete